MKWWRRRREHTDLTAVEEAERRAQEVEGRAAKVARQVREDPWSARVLDAIHRRRGDPHAG